MDFLNRLGGEDSDMDLEDPEIMKELKKLGWDQARDEDFELNPEDQEIAELERRLEQEERELEASMKGADFRPMSEHEIENMQLDEKDLENPEYLSELMELEGKHKEDVLQEHVLQLDELKKIIAIQTNKAVQLRNAGNKDEALEILKEIKRLKVEQDNLERMIKMHQITQKPQASNKKPEVTPKPVKKQNAQVVEEEEEFDYDSIVSLPVMEWEMEQAARRKDEFVKDKMEFAIQMLTTNIQSGILSQETYVENIQQKIEENKKIVEKANREVRARLMKHIELMEAELADIPDEEEEEEEEEEGEQEEEKIAPQKQPTEISHEELYETNLMYRDIGNLYDEYKRGFLYLRQLGETTLCNNLIEKAETLGKILSDMRRGKEPSGKINPLMPSDITGMTESERLKRLEELIEYTTKQHEEAKQQALACLKQKDKEGAVAKKREMLSHEKKLKELEDAKKNPWQLPPRVNVKKLSRREEVMNSDLGPTTIELGYGKAEGLKNDDSYYIQYGLTLHAGQNIERKLAVKKHVLTEGFGYLEKFNLDAKSFASLDKRRINIEIFEKRMIRSDKSIGNINLKLADCANKCNLNFKLPISKSSGIYLNMTLRLHKALKVKEYHEVPYEETTIEEMPPSFKDASGQAIVPKSNLPEETKEPKRGAPSPAGPKQATEASADLSPAEITDPSILDNLNSYEVLSMEIERLTELINKLRSDGKNVTPLINRQRDVMRKKAIIETQVGNGMISPEQYKEVLENQISHDMQLAKYFKDNGDRAKLELVIKRVQIMKKEVSELEGE
jgi:hypothetical protein